MKARRQTCEPCLQPLAKSSRIVPMRNDEPLAKLAWAIAHPARVRILRLLIARQSCVCGELVDELPLAQSTVSQHLKILREAGLIRGEIDGPKVCYCVDVDAVDRLKELIGEI